MGTSFFCSINISTGALQFWAIKKRTEPFTRQKDYSKICELERCTKRTGALQSFPFEFRPFKPLLVYKNSYFLVMFPKMYSSLLTKPFLLSWFGKNCMEIWSDKNEQKPKKKSNNWKILNFSNFKKIIQTSWKWVRKSCFMELHNFRLINSRPYTLLHSIYNEIDKMKAPSQLANHHSRLDPFLFGLYFFTT